MDGVLPLAVAHRRLLPIGGLDYFPTPPWATRALFEHVLGNRPRRETVEEPACGEGHMSWALGDYFDVVRASDVADYGFGDVRDFLDASAWDGIPRPDWIVTNPPFGPLSVPFFERATARARRGVAMFVRTTQLEGIRRFALFRSLPPEIVAQFAERVPLHEGRWEPDGGTQTAYCWIVWRLDRRPRATELRWIPPGCRERLHFSRDVARFGGAA